MRRYLVILFWLVLLGLVGLSLLRYFYVTNEDAFIAFRYARNLADGYGLVSNPGGATQEGFSDLSYILVLAFLNYFLGFDFIYAGKVIGILSVFAIFGLNFLILKLFIKALKKDMEEADNKFVLKLVDDKRFLMLLNVILIAVIGFSQYVAWWATEGMETMLYAAVILGMVYLIFYALFYRRYGYFYGIAVVAFFSLNTRPEGIMNFFVFLGVLMIWLLINRRMERELVKKALGSFMVFVLLTGALFLWKKWYFGGFIANPTYFKLAVAVFYYEYYTYFLQYFKTQGWGFVMFFLLSLGGYLYLLLKAILKGKYRNSALFFTTILGFILSQFLFVMRSHGDYMKNFRFLITHYPLMVIFMLFCLFSVGLFLKAKRSYLILVIFISFAVLFFPNYFDKILIYNWYETGFVSPDAWVKGQMRYRIAQKIKNEIGEDEYYANSETGLVSYHAERNLIDTLFLGDKMMARNFSQYSANFNRDNNVYQACRDFVLSKKPKMILVIDLYFDGDMNVRALNTVSWFFNSYLESNFFQKNYHLYDVKSDSEFTYKKDDVHDYWGAYLSNGEYKSDTLAIRDNNGFTYKNGEEDNFWGVYVWNGKYSPTSVLMADNKDDRDKLLYGFQFEEDKVWASPLSRVLLMPREGDKYLVLKGYINDISLFKDKKNTIEVRYNVDYVGDKLLGFGVLEDSGFFELKFKIDNKVFVPNEDVLLTLKGDLSHILNGDVRELSYVFDSIYFSEL